MHGAVRVSSSCSNKWGAAAVHTHMLVRFGSRSDSQLRLANIGVLRSIVMTNAILFMLLHAAAV